NGLGKHLEQKHPELVASKFQFLADDEAGDSYDNNDNEGNSYEHNGDGGVLGDSSGNNDNGSEMNMVMAMQIHVILDNSMGQSAITCFLAFNHLRLKQEYVPTFQTEKQLHK
ncbi:hypothetical protein HK100_010357, partial [Physocladia obscura]